MSCVDMMVSDLAGRNDTLIEKFDRSLLKGVRHLVHISYFVIPHSQERLQFFIKLQFEDSLKLSMSCFHPMTASILIFASLTHLSLKATF